MPLWVSCTIFNGEPNLKSYTAGDRRQRSDFTFWRLTMNRIRLIAMSVAVCGIFAASSAFAGCGCKAQADCCEAAPTCCEPAPVCCPPPPPPPVEVTFCVTDPVTCCKYSVTACVPAECACQTPCLVGCRPGFLGRKILTYKFPCGHCVDVVITKFGRVIVRD